MKLKPGYNDVLLRAIPLTERVDHLSDVQGAPADVAERRDAEVLEVLLQGLEDAARHERLQAGSTSGRPHGRVLPDLIAESTALHRRDYAVLGTGIVAPLGCRCPDVGCLQGRATECLLVHGDLRVARRRGRRVIHGEQEDVDAEYH